VASGCTAADLWAATGGWRAISKWSSVSAGVARGAREVSTRLWGLAPPGAAGERLRSSLTRGSFGEKPRVRWGVRGAEVRGKGAEVIWSSEKGSTGDA
jgi:hypothetical protein